MSSHFTFIRIATVRQIVEKCAGEVVERLKLIYFGSEGQSFSDSFWQFLRILNVELLVTVILLLGIYTKELKTTVCTKVV